MRIWWKPWNFFPEKWKVQKPISTPHESQRCTSYQMKEEKETATPNFATENQTFHLLNLLRKTGLLTDSKPKALGRWINLKPPLVQCMDPSHPELSSPKLHMDTSCLSVLSSNVTFSERITFLTLYQKQPVGLHDHISLYFHHIFSCIQKCLRFLIYLSPLLECEFPTGK